MAKKPPVGALLRGLRLFDCKSKRIVPGLDFELPGISAYGETWYNYQFFGGFTLSSPVFKNISKILLDKLSGGGVECMMP